MRPAPVANEDETYINDDARVADPLSNKFMELLNTTARVNREVFTELFRPVPSNLVRNWNAYDVSARRRRRNFCAKASRSRRYISQRSTWAMSPLISRSSA